MENLANSELLLSGTKLNKQFRPTFGARIYMSHPENERQLCPEKRPKRNLNPYSVKQSNSNALTNLHKIDLKDIKRQDCCTQTSKTILQLAELDMGYLSPDSLQSSPTKKAGNDYEQFNSCSENLDMSVPYMRKAHLQNGLYDTKKSQPGACLIPHLNASLTDTFLAKRQTEETYPAYECRSRFLQQISPLRKLSNCNPEFNFQSESCLKPDTFPNHMIKKNLAPLSRFTVKNLRNQEPVEDMSPLVFWSKTDNTITKDYKPKQNEFFKNLRGNKKRGNSFMSPTIASEQRNQQHLVKAVNGLMSPNRRGRSLSPNRLSGNYYSIDPDRNQSFTDHIQDQVLLHKPLHRHMTTKRHRGIKSFSDLPEYTKDDNGLKIDLSNLHTEALKAGPSLVSSTTSMENLIFQIIARIKDNDWSISLKGFAEIIDCYCSMDTDLLSPHTTTINQKLLQLLRSSRSYVSRTACQIAGRLFETMKDTRRPEFDDIVEILLSKTADSNKFIRADANKSLDCMITHIQTFHAIRSLCLKGPCHKHPLVRTATLRLILDAVIKVGPKMILEVSTNEATRKRIIRFFPQFLFDKHLETRKHGERLFEIFATEQSFDYYLRKYLDPNDINRIKLLKFKNLKR